MARGNIKHARKAVLASPFAPAPSKSAKLRAELAAYQNLAGLRLGWHLGETKAETHRVRALVRSYNRTYRTAAELQGFKLP